MTHRHEAAQEAVDHAAGPAELAGVPQYLSIGELASATTLSVSTLRRLLRQGVITGYQPGGRRHRIVFPADAIRQATQSRPEPAPSHNGPPRRGPRPQWAGE